MFYFYFYWIPFIFKILGLNWTQSLIWHLQLQNSVPYILSLKNIRVHKNKKKTLSKGFPFSSGFKISSLTSFLLKRNGFSRTGESELSILNITRKVHVYLYTENCSLQMFLKLIFSFGSDFFFFLCAADEKQ